MCPISHAFVTIITLFLAYLTMYLEITIIYFLHLRHYHMYDTE